MITKLSTYLLFLSLLALGACANYGLANRVPPDYPGSVTKTEGQSTASDEGMDDVILLEDRQVSYNYSVRLLVKSQDSLLTKISQLSERFDGYVQSSDKYHVVLMVNSQRAEEALEQLATLGKLKSKEIQSEDITLQTKDYAIRLENAQKTRDRYLALLDKAKTVEEIIKIEKELERLNTKIELFKGFLAHLQNRVNLSQINIRIQKRVKPGPLGYVFVGLYEGVKWIFVRN